MISNSFSMGIIGIDSFLIKTETDVSSGLPSFDIVGLPDTSIKESRDRVRAAIKNCGFVYPMSRITVNLSPADIKKAGPSFDLPIMISLLKASNQLNVNTDDSIFIGELSLSGNLNPVNGILSMVSEAKKLGFKKVFLPYQNAKEGAVVSDIDVFPIKNVPQLIDHLNQKNIVPPQPVTSISINKNDSALDFSHVKGQFDVKRAVEIAAAGGHNILLIGPPGSGKSMIVKRIPSILPKMTFSEMMETTKIYSASGLLPKDTPLVTERPFRAPHHTVSSTGLSGGGSIPRPGELSLAHNGILFLDELPEFSRNTVETLRQPIEDGVVTICRVRRTLTYPCSVMLVAAMNPCPCGYLGHPSIKCTCTQKAISKYLSKISGPLLDRIDIHIEVPPVSFEKLSSNTLSESSAEIKQRVNSARDIQVNRFKNLNISCNARINPGKINQLCVLDDSAKRLLKSAFDKLDLSARAYDKILKLARTIADLENSELICSHHISEAIQYRCLDRKYWAR